MCLLPDLDSSYDILYGVSLGSAMVQLSEHLPRQTAVDFELHTSPQSYGAESGSIRVLIVILLRLIFHRAQ